MIFPLKPPFMGIFHGYVKQPDGKTDLIQLYPTYFNSNRLIGGIQKNTFFWCVPFHIIGFAMFRPAAHDKLHQQILQVLGDDFAHVLAGSCLGTATA